MAGVSFQMWVFFLVLIYLFLWGVFSVEGHGGGVEAVVVYDCTHYLEYSSLTFS